MGIFFIFDAGRLNSVDKETCTYVSAGWHSSIDVTVIFSKVNHTLRFEPISPSLKVKGFANELVVEHQLHYDCIVTLLMNASSHEIYFC